MFSKKIKKTPSSGITYKSNIPSKPIQNNSNIQQNKNTFSNALLGSQNIEKQKNNISAQELLNNRIKQEKIALTNRTNTPYKNILPSEYFNKTIKSEKDLIVYTVNKNDKHAKLINDSVMNLKKTIHNQNVQIENKYNINDKLKYKEIFDQNNIIKCNINYNQKTNTELKQNALSYYETKQKENEQNKQKIDEMIDMLSYNNIM